MQKMESKKQLPSGKKLAKRKSQGVETRAEQNRTKRALAAKTAKKRGAKRFHVITLFPELCAPYTSGSILGRAEEQGFIKTEYVNPRDFTLDKWSRVDQRPYGGGPGMVLMAEPFLKAVSSALGRRKKKVKTIFFAPEGKQFTNDLARAWVNEYDEFVFICGRYEGIDARVKEVLNPDVVTVGPFVLTGGEVPALLCIDAMTRQVPGVLGDFASLEEERVASPDSYTRPDVLTWKKKKYSVPPVLLSGDHKKMEVWRKEQLIKAAQFGGNKNAI